MEITNEIIAKYIDGTATPEEVSCVRQYLVQHPEERESILLLMDDHLDYLEEWGESEVGSDRAIEEFPNLIMSAAAFAPTKNHSQARCKKVPCRNQNSFLTRLGDMLKEIDSV